MITAEIEFIPMPANVELFSEDVTYIAIDDEGKPHVAHWNGECLILDNGERYPDEPEEGEEDEEDEVEIVLIGVMPELELPTSI